MAYVLASDPVVFTSLVVSIGLMAVLMGIWGHRSL